jgi:DNA polymerase IV
MERTIFHIDIDAFFASVEQRDHPEYLGKPVIVGARPGHRGVVSTCSYEARKFGVHSAMPISRAVQLCPGAVFLPVRFDRYREASRIIMGIFADYTPDVRQISIDEAFLDMTGTTRLFGPAEGCARSIKKRVNDETGLTISVGVAPNRYVAKLASEHSKPNGLLVVPEGGEEDFIALIPLRKLWGIGDKSYARLEELGIDSIQRARSYSETILRSLLGDSFGSFLYGAIRGRDPGIFQDEAKSRSVSTETTFERDVVDTEILSETLLQMAAQLAATLYEEEIRSRTVCLKLRYDDFTTVSCRETSERFLSTTDEIYGEAVRLLERKREKGRPVRLIGVGLSSVESSRNSGTQTELFDEDRERKRKVEKAVLGMKQKLGKVDITRARLLKPPQDGPGD